MKGKINLSMKARRDIVGYIFVFPALLCFIIFVLIPLILSLVLSFYKTDMFFMDMESVGFANFGRVFRDTLFWRSIGNILLYTLMAVPMNVILSLVLAALVNSKIRGSKVFRLLFYLPSITSTVAASIVWLWLMNPAYGLLNEILNAFGLPDATWLSHSSTALISVTLITVWQGVGGNMIIFVAALQNVPQQLYEAAKLDGAGPFTMFFRITIPMLMPGIISGALLSITLSLDDVIISYFVTGAGDTTLPIKVYGMARGKISTEVYALFTLMIIITILLYLLFTVVRSISAKRQS